MVADAVHEMLRNAFLKIRGLTSGGIAGANQGVVQFLPLDGDSGVDYDREKKIRVVSTAKYYLVY